MRFCEAACLMEQRVKVGWRWEGGSLHLIGWEEVERRSGASPGVSRHADACGRGRGGRQKSKGKRGTPGCSSVSFLPTLLSCVTAHLLADALSVCCYTLAGERAPVALRRRALRFSHSRSSSAVIYDWLSRIRSTLKSSLWVLAATSTGLLQKLNELHVRCVFAGVQALPGPQAGRRSSR